MIESKVVKGQSSRHPDRTRVAVLMRRVGEAMRHRFAEVLAEHEMTQPMGLVLAHLETGCPMGHMADRLSVDASYVTALADRLEELSLVARVPSSSDRRVKELVLTDEGRRVRASIHERLASHPMFDRLSDHEAESLAELLEIMLADENTFESPA